LIVEMLIVSVLGIAAGYACRDYISRTRRAKERERWRTRNGALKYPTSPAEPLDEKWDDCRAMTSPADSVARSDEDRASQARD
jgi:hypothetical protein